VVDEPVAGQYSDFLDSAVLELNRRARAAIPGECANIGGLITAVGVTSIVIGLAVQTAVGPVIQGLLLLFEQPFRIGDLHDTAPAKGRVVEVNWRAVHIDTGNGIQIVPNATLATGSFTNLSRVTGAAFNATAVLTFDAGDPPGVVTAALQSVADALPTKLAIVPAKVVALGEAKYKVLVPFASPAEESRTKTILLHRVWYAAQRAGVHIDGADLSKKADRAYLDTQLHSIAASLGLGEEAVAAMAGHTRRLLYAEGELIQPTNSIPEAVGFITEGKVGGIVYAHDGRELALGRLGVGDYIGGTSLTRQRMLTATRGTPWCSRITGWHGRSVTRSRCGARPRPRRSPKRRKGCASS
jgi:hypothetical protein